MTAIIECKELTKSYGRKVALSSVGFSLQQGDITALVGPNGAGKTTLFSILCGYIRPDSGSVRLFGKMPGSTELFGLVSALPQDAQFDPAFGIGEQLDFYGRLQGLSASTAKRETERVLTLVGLAEQKKLKAAALSHGMRKRAAIAQAFIGSPKLVLLDEPTAGLDPENALYIRQLISRLSSEVSFLISSHNIFELEQLCNRVLYLEQGQLKSTTDDTSTEQQQSYLTLHLEQDNIDPIRQTLATLPFVLDVRQGQRKELVVCCNLSAEHQPDLAILQCLAANGWHYRSLTKGQTLEQKLFKLI